MNKLLLLQARLTSDPMLSHEHQCVATQAELELEQLLTHNLVNGLPSPTLVEQATGIVLGGSGAFYASAGDMPHFDAYMTWLSETVATQIPILGICYGHHCLARALGAELFHGPENAEVGSYWLDTCDAASDDLLFQCNA